MSVATIEKPKNKKKSKVKASVKDKKVKTALKAKQDKKQSVPDLEQKLLKLRNQVSAAQFEMQEVEMQLIEIFGNTATETPNLKYKPSYVRKGNLTLNKDLVMEKLKVQNLDEYKTRGADVQVKAKITVK